MHWRLKLYIVAEFQITYLCKILENKKNFLNYHKNLKETRNYIDNYVFFNKLIFCDHFTSAYLINKKYYV